MSQIAISRETASKIATAVGNGISADKVLEELNHEHNPDLPVAGIACGLFYGLDMPIKTVIRVLKDCLNQSATDIAAALVWGLSSLLETYP